MIETSIYYKNKTNLINQLLEDENIVDISEKSFISKLSFSKKEYSDIYFHSGDIDDESIDKVLNSKKTIVNSKTIMNQFIRQNNELSNKIEVIYPSINIKYEKPKDVKERFCKKNSLDKKKKLILFDLMKIRLPE